MKLTNSFFSSIKDKVKAELYCIIPKGKNSDIIDYIDTDAFKDWTSLKYVYIPPSIKNVAPNAFDYSKINFIFLDKNTTKIQGDTGSAKLIQITNQSKEIFDLIVELYEIKSKINFNPDEITKVNESITKKLKSFEQDIQEKENTLTTTYNKLITEIQKIEDISQKEDEALSLILSKANERIKEYAEEIAKTKSENLEQIYTDIVKKISQEASKVFSMQDETMKNVKDQLLELKTELSNFEKKKNKLSEDVNKAAEALDKSLEDAKNYLHKIKEKVVEEVVKEASERIKEINPCRQIIINIGDVEKKFNSKELFHKDFEKVLKLVLAHKPLLLKGPAGSGKNVIIEQIAKSMDLQFYYLNDVTDEYKIMGFVDANGNFKETQFFKAFTNGGIMFIDEIDNSNPSALLAINASIGTGHNHYMAFPDGNFYQAHKDFYLIAAANTFGTGADSIYCGRQALDGATLNRFIPVVIDYDKELESNLIFNKEILNLYWDIRKIINDNQIRHVISTRNIKNADDLMCTEAFSLEDIFDWTIIQGLDKNSLRIISTRLNSNNYYSRKFIEHLNKNHNISGDEYDTARARTKVRDNYDYYGDY